MPWSKILRNFRMIPHNPSAADFHGPYNKLLYTFFPLDNNFTVFPRYEPVDPEELESSAVTERFFFDVRYDDKPVFILEHKAPQDLKYGSVRDSADRQLRDRVENTRSYCPLPVLHAASAFGTRLCFYKIMRHEDLCNHPPPIYEPESVSLRVTGRAPQERWDCDILKEDGEKRFKSMVEEIKQACAAL